MSVLPMKRVTICGLKKDRKQVLELLQRQGVIEIGDGVSEDDVFQKADMSSYRATFDKNRAIAAHALEILDTYAPVKLPMFSSLEGRKVLSVEDYEAYVGRRDKVMQACFQLQALEKRIGESLANRPKVEAQLEALAPWSGFDLPLSFKGTEKTAAFIGTLPGGMDQAQIYGKLAEHAPEVEGVDVTVVSSQDEQTCVFLVCAKADQEGVEEALRRMNFARPPLSQLVPAQLEEDLKHELDVITVTCKGVRAEIASYGEMREAIRFMVDYFAMRSEKYGVISGLSQSRRVFLLSGYIPEREGAKLESLLNARFDLAIELEAPGQDEDVPVLLHNNAFATPVETVVESYSLPGKGEFDPSMVVACFYYLLFGMMLSDAAYGIVVIIGCGWALHRFKGMEEGMKKTIRMFLYCGVSTAFWGFLFGGFFGDATKVIATTFFGRTDITIPPLWFEPVTQPMRMLVVAFAIGIVHVFVGLGMKFCTCVKNGQWKDAIYDAVFYYLIVGGGVAYLLTMPMITEMLGLGFTLSSPVPDVAGICAMIGAIGIVLTSGRESRNPVKRLLKGIYGLYNITGYLSDILSYSRLLALGLATGVIAQVFNKMGSMVGGGAIGVVVFVAIFVVGHTMNIGINMLGAYVHTNRLHYVEFFSKFYEGGGRKFAPFQVNTKYYKIKEDI